MESAHSRASKIIDTLDPKKMVSLLEFSIVLSHISDNIFTAMTINSINNSYSSTPSSSANDQGYRAIIAIIESSGAMYKNLTESSDAIRQYGDVKKLVPFFESKIESIRRIFKLLSDPEMPKYHMPSYQS